MASKMTKTAQTTTKYDQFGWLANVNSIGYTNKYIEIIKKKHIYHGQHKRLY